MDLKTIVVIEDELDVREILMDILEAEGFNVLGAMNGREGVELVLQSDPDLVLCDVMMPEMDGFEVVAALRENSATATTPFIFLTAKAMKGDLQQGMNLGADYYLTKPFTRQELLDAIASRLQQQERFEAKSEKRMEALIDSIIMVLPHEFHTPLNGIIAASQYVLDEAEDIEPDELAIFMRDINQSGQRLYRLIQNFLLRTELETLTRDPEKLAMVRSLTVDRPMVVIQEAVTAHLRQDNYEARMGDVTVEGEDELVRVADTGLQKVAVELIDNALKFSEVGSPVKLSARVVASEQGDRYCVTVTDQGRGMAKDQISRIGAYQKFNRNDREKQGAGLGLSIVQQLVTLYDGQLQIDSELGQGTTVQVSFAVGTPDTIQGLRPELGTVSE